MARILIIEDNEQIRTMLSMMLEKAGYEVDQAPEGLTGVERFRLHKPDLVITDIVMPEKEGLETIMELRQIDPDTRIIAISGSGAGGAQTYLDSALALGAAKAFHKPVERTELLNAVEALLTTNG